jgi:hypothetical protein
VSFETQSCVVISCDGGCDDPWEEGTPHFADEAEAVEYVRSCGWIVTGPRALCADCAAKETCARVGHRWGDWHDPIEREGVRWRTRYCEHCSGSDHDPPWDELMVLSRAAEVINGAASGGEG